jgi:hypothetical protein
MMQILMMAMVAQALALLKVDSNVPRIVIALISAQMFVETAF